MTAVAIVVIGAGPAGLAVAYAAVERGARVTVLDAADQLGGQYWRHPSGSDDVTGNTGLQHGWSRFTQLRAALTAHPRCTVLTNAHVWAIEPGEPATVHVLLGLPDGADREAQTFRPDRLVLATGAHDRTLPFPGWDLPGVYTAGAAQAYAKGEGLALGQRVVVAGAGPFLLPVAAALSHNGARVLGVVEASPVGQLARGWLARPWQLFGSVGKVTELAGYIAGQAGGRIPYLPGHAVVAAHGDTAVEAVTIARVDARWSPIPGTEQRMTADTVCVSHGFTPRLELALAAGCRLTDDRFVAVDTEQASSRPGVYAAGEITGIAGADAALAEGSIAGHCAAGGSSRDRELAGVVRVRHRSQDFARRLTTAHGVGAGWPDWLTDETLVCRCEEISYGRLRSVAAATPDAGLRSVKLTTRAGLGPCQARICGRTVEELLGRPGETSSDRRPIAAPLRLGELAAHAPDPSDLEPRDPRLTPEPHDLSPSASRTSPPTIKEPT